MTDAKRAAFHVYDSRQILLLISFSLSPHSLSLCLVTLFYTDRQDTPIPNTMKGLMITIEEKLSSPPSPSSPQTPTTTPIPCWSRPTLFLLWTLQFLISAGCAYFDRALFMLEISYGTNLKASYEPPPISLSSCRPPLFKNAILIPKIGSSSSNSSSRPSS